MSSCSCATGLLKLPPVTTVQLQHRTLGRSPSPQTCLRRDCVGRDRSKTLSRLESRSRRAWRQWIWQAPRHGQHTLRCGQDPSSAARHIKCCNWGSAPSQVGGIAAPGRMHIAFHMARPSGVRLGACFRLTPRQPEHAAITEQLAVCNRELCLRLGSGPAEGMALMPLTLRAASRRKL